MSKVDEYARALRELDDPESYLLEHSGLPGPRGNIELARAAAEVRSSAELRRWASLDPDVAPTGSADEFLAFCGVVGLGRLLAEGNGRALADLRRHANDPRWRVREGVAMALQRWGSEEFDALAAAMAEWASGSWLERRAAAAALCEPALLTDGGRVKAVLAVLDEATAGVASARRAERRSDELKALRRPDRDSPTITGSFRTQSGLRPAHPGSRDPATFCQSFDGAWPARGTRPPIIDLVIRKGVR